MKIVINCAIGGYQLHRKVVEEYVRRKGLSIECYEVNEECQYWTNSDGEPFSPEFDIERHDPILVEIIEELGPHAETAVCTPKLVEIPDGIDYRVIETDCGSEYIVDTTRIWS